SDTWVQQRRYTVPPEIQNGAQVTRVRRQTAMRSTLMGRSQVGAWQLRGQAHAQHLQQDWRRFTDATLGTALGDEAVQSQRFGGGMWGERPVAQRWALRLGSTVQHDRALAQSLNGQQVRGDATVVEPALGMQGQLHPHWQAALSAGAALPTGGITPWPEARLMLRYRPQADHHEATRQRWELRWTLARKGRLPSLRERFEPGFENPDLGPEIDNFGEMRLRLRPLPWLGLGGAGFVRHTEGFIRFNDARTARVNRGDAVVEGFDTRLDLFPVAGLKLGAAYNQLFAGRQARDLGIFDNTPQQRLDGWIEYGWRGKFGTWTRSRWLGSRSEGGEPVPAFWGVDAALWYKPHPTWRTSLRVDNVLDREQYLRPSVLAPGRSVVLSVDGQWP
ncbi:MAG: TonB-dependent receptor domain-containing protein, partial [Polyangiales bacterium]